jgi:uncharacterized protein (TIGR03067 family)
MLSSSILIMAFCVLVQPTIPVHPVDETAGLTGMYLMVSIEKNGEKLPERHVQGQMVRITQDRIIATDKESKQTFAASYRVNASNTPWNITMKSIAPQTGLEARGLIKREGDMVWLIYHHPGGEVPTEFKTKQKQLMIVLRKLDK